MSVETELLERAGNRCELCSSSENIECITLSPYTEIDDKNSLAICNVCNTQYEGTNELNVNHWRCLNDSMWSEFPAVQVMAWRMLNKLRGEGWAQDLLDQLYLSEDQLEWAKIGLVGDNESSVKTVDCNGTDLYDGDSVTLIKDLDVKGANFTAKRGTMVKKISLTDDPTHIEGRVSGQQIYLKTCFLKKA